MREDDKILNALPKVEPSLGFEDQLFADALSFMPKNDDEIELLRSPLSSKNKAPYWIGFAFAASMAFGVWIGMGNLAVTQESLTGLGFADSTASADLEIDIYGDALMGLSS